MIKNAAIALFFQREVYLVKLNYNKGWTFPGGRIDRGETSYDAAFREFDEETGTAGLKNWVERKNISQKMNRVQVAITCHHLLTGDCATQGT